jgi:hypothetical protein
MALKIADLVKSFPAKWRLMAETTCMKPNWAVPSRPL